MLFLSVESPVVGDVRFVFIWLYRGVRGKCICDLISSEIPNLLNNMRPVVVYYEFTGESGAVYHNKTHPKASPQLSVHLVNRAKCKLSSANLCRVLGRVVL